MKISELFSSNRRLYSFEFFPPKTDAGEAALEKAISELEDLQPAYVSVTYGAGGSTRDRTIDLVSRIQAKGITAMAHLTCVGANKAEIGAVVERLAAAGIDNIIALRGDPPAGSDQFKAHEGGFAYASELAAYIRQNHPGRFCVAGAGYPEGHVECRDLDLDIINLKKKVNAGADFIVSQMFFDNRHYYEFVERARNAGIKVPIVPGIMPILNVGQIERFTKMCGVNIPAGLHRELDRHRNDPVAAQQLGTAYATAQCVDLLKRGAPGIHFYTLNQSTATRMILTALRACGLA
ncbi:MAG: methylenetetrahydrofolate reductase [NAD(P)H] [Deltaproteobacteria bacterium]|nr:methylenetetrahydrofolate reductase [NAD(P)H] [Deltaproteobacteria bacterium]